ncbi:hypothetical protein MN0502_18180 [Arthrobacter sp. MN05-02]|nr:hypothetical protein MN0502_18180 [Arthrobacter sp. MN05-02]
MLVRRPEAATGLAPIGASLGIGVTVAPWAGAGRALEESDVVVSTLPPRAADALCPLRDGFRTDGTLLDVAYDPWPSALAAHWQRAGGTIVPGLDMLLHQAVEQVRLFFPDTGQDRTTILNVMCDAVGAPRH